MVLALQEKLHRRGEAWVSVAPVGGEHVLRCNRYVQLLFLLPFCSDNLKADMAVVLLTDACSRTQNSR